MIDINDGKCNINENNKIMVGWVLIEWLDEHK